ncbi:MFS transporter [Microbacterium maritypicum]
MALAEGTANDWLPLILVDGHGFDASAGATIFILFAAAMTAGRFVGGWFIDKFGRIVVLCASALFAVLGLALVASVDVQMTVVAAVLRGGAPMFLVKRRGRRAQRGVGRGCRRGAWRTGRRSVVWRGR